MSLTPRQALQRTIDHREIFPDEMTVLMRAIMRGEVPAPMVAALLVGLRVKKETIGEISAAAAVLREFARKVEGVAHPHLVDIVGTGGDGANTFNISTAASLVAAAAGARVAKHGNRGVSSTSGAADVLEAFGAAIELGPEQVATCIEKLGFGFMFAPIHHPALKIVAPVRNEIGIRTIFNILGPLVNPADAPNILMGVFHPDLVGIQARVLLRLGAKRALVVWGEDGVDEISLGASTRVAELVNGSIREYSINPTDFGIRACDMAKLQVKTPAESRAFIEQALGNKAGPACDVVLLNAGAALYAAGVAQSIADGIAFARDAVASGAAKAKLAAFVALTQQLSADG